MEDIIQKKCEPNNLVGNRTKVKSTTDRGYCSPMIRPGCSHGAEFTKQKSKSSSRTKKSLNSNQIGLNSIGKQFIDLDKRLFRANANIEYKSFK
jgi:hypothetical protein